LWCDDEIGPRVPAARRSRDVSPGVWALSSGIKFAAREQAQAFAVGMLGAEVDVDPAEAMVQAVRLAAGMVAYYRVRIGGMSDEMGMSEQAAIEQGLAQSIERYGRIAKMALDAGIEARKVRAIERLVEPLVAAAEAGIEAMVAVGLDVSSAHRTAFAREFASRIGAMEQRPAIEGVAHDA
jgi:hypothetical protein